MATVETAYDVLTSLNLIGKPCTQENGEEKFGLDDFCQAMLKLACAMSEKYLYEYQQEFFLRCIRAILEHRGDMLTGLWSRQSGKTETIAAIVGSSMIMLPEIAKQFPNDWRLNITDDFGRYRGYKNGISFGIYAPILEQSQIMFERIRDNLDSEGAQNVMKELGLEYNVNRGNVVLLSNGSTALAMSASKNSKIEGHTHHVVIAEEAQDIDTQKIRKSIHPMVASTKGTIIKIGTASTHKGDFFQSIKHNKRLEVVKNVRNHFFFPYQVCQQYNSSYRDYLAEEKLRIGANSDEFRMSYGCLVPETRILTADLRYIPIKDACVGTRLVGFDENRCAKGVHRQFQNTTVTRYTRLLKKCYTLELSDGSTVTASHDHSWLVFTAGGRTIWKTTRDLAASDRIFKVAETWKRDRSYESGYLAAAFEGEGHLCCLQKGKSRHLILGFTQKDNVMLARVRKYLTQLGYKFWESRQTHNRGVIRLGVAGGRAVIMRFLGTIRPRRLLQKFDAAKLGSVGRHDKCKGNEGFDHPYIVAKRFSGVREVIALETDTRTYVAEGLASHNCEWMLERGMFITDKYLMANGVAITQGKYSDLHNDGFYGLNLVVGIDLGKETDSTVVTVMDVDWSVPAIEQTIVRGYVETDYVAYLKHVVAWMEMQGDDYEHQFHRIVEWLQGFKPIRKIVLDATREASFADRMAHHPAFAGAEIQDFVFSVQTKAAGYRQYNDDILGKRFTFPAGQEARMSPEYRKFVLQMLDLVKTYSGEYLMVAHPDETGAHDDYACSVMLANWGANTPTKDLQIQYMDVNAFTAR